jgi:hypothetical protein
MSDTKPEVVSLGAIEGESHPLIDRYFEALNAERYDSTALLFAADGALLPPFEEPIVGQEAIASYLAAEATGMQLYPRQGTSQVLEDGNTEYRITGKVQTPLFGVNVAWIFVINRHSELMFVRVRLLASPQELLNLRR